MPWPRLDLAISRFTNSLASRTAHFWRSSCARTPRTPALSSTTRQGIFINRGRDISTQILVKLSLLLQLFDGLLQTILTKRICHTVFRQKYSERAVFFCFNPVPSLLYYTSRLSWKRIFPLQLFF